MAAGRDATLIRRAEPPDAAALAEIHVRTWRVAYEPVFGADRLAQMDVSARRAQWDRWLADGVDAWVAEDDGGRVVGFVWIGDSREDPGEGELFAIYVLPEAWGGGAGHDLMGTALQALRASYETAILYVLEANPRARRFYEREGWSLDGGVKEDEFVGVPVRELRYRITFAT